ncbi:DNA primase [bacterium]|nr:DNA primase [bacterium]
MLYPQEILDDIATRLDIVSVVGEHVVLKKSGINYKGLCPFHQEKSPSFMVNPEKNIFHCFGCGVGGNVFSFLMKKEGKTFPEAVRDLAARAGVDLSRFTKETSGADTHSEIYYRINRYAGWFFHQQLSEPQGKVAFAYTQKRKLSPEIMADFKLGYAPASWDGLSSFLNKKGVPMEEALTLSLVRQKESRVYDFFRDRLMFPIIDAEGRVIAFGGRRLNDKSDEPKYINSPESPVYSKGREVFGLFQAKKHIREKDQIIIVEGYMDLITLHQAGLNTAVAPLGTALTPMQVKKLSRYSRNFCLLFDGDNAGFEASLRSISIFLKEGFHPKLVILPPGEDPDTFIHHNGAEALQKLVREALPALDTLLLKYFSEASSKTSDKVGAAQKIAPLLDQIGNEIEKKAYQAKISKLVGVEENKASSRSFPPESYRGKTVVKAGNQLKISLERNLLELYVKYPDRVSSLFVEEDLKLVEDETLKKLFGLIADEFKKKGMIRVEELLSPALGDGESILSRIVFGDAVAPAEEELTQMISDCYGRWKAQKLKDQLAKITSAIHLAELKGDQDEIARLLSQKSEAVKQMGIKH